MKQTETLSRNGTTRPTLEALAKEIKDLHEKCLEGVRSSLRHARETGLRLSEAKKAVKAEHGKLQWRRWLRKHCALDLRVAQNYMQIAKHPENLLKVSNGKRCQTITEALRRIREVRREGRGQRPAAEPVGGLFCLSARKATQKWQEAKRYEKDDRLDHTANEQIDHFVSARVRSLLIAVRHQAVRKTVAETNGEALDTTLYAVVILRRLAERLNSPSLLRAAPEKATEKTRKRPA